MREFDEAITFIKKALRRDNKNFYAHYRLGLCQIRNNMRDEGIKSLKTALKLSPNDLETQLKLAEVYLREEATLKDAKDIIKMVVRQNPNLCEGYIQLGRVYDKEGKHDDALETFKKALQISTLDKNNKKANLNAHFFTGCQYEQLKDPKQSIFHFKQCLLFDQSHFGACIHLATQLANSGDFPKAEKYFRHCIKLNPTSVPAHFGLGKILQHFEQ